jgi:AcrR family transcriptional regulator
MARPVQADAEATRRNILAAATGLFSDKGLAPTTTREIARSAGVSLATVHHYFGGKNELYRACVDAMYTELDGLRAEIEASLLEARARGAGIDELVEAAVRRVWRFARRHRPAIQLMVRTVLDTGEMERDKRERYLMPFLDQGTGFLAPLIDRPAFEVRCALLALNYLMTRFTLSSAAELAIALDMAGAPDDQVLGAVEDYLARRARAELTRGDRQ